MAHLDHYLPREIELGAVRRSREAIDIVTTDGGFEVRNSRWSGPLLTFEVSFPTSRRDGAVYEAVRWLYEASRGGLHSFNFHDWTDDSGSTVVPVRFDSPLEITGVTGWLDHIETITLTEVRL